MPQSVSEARCLLDIARASRDICCAKKRLADAILKETTLRVQYYTIQAVNAARGLEDAELDVGRISLVVQNSGHDSYPTPLEAASQYGKKCMYAIHCLNVMHTHHFSGHFLQHCGAMRVGTQSSLYNWIDM